MICCLNISSSDEEFYKMDYLDHFWTLYLPSAAHKKKIELTLDVKKTSWTSSGRLMKDSAYSSQDIPIYRLDMETYTAWNASEFVVFLVHIFQYSDRNLISKSPFSDRMRYKLDEKNSEFEHFCVVIRAGALIFPITFR